MVPRTLVKSNASNIFFCVSLHGVFLWVVSLVLLGLPAFRLSGEASFGLKARCNDANRGHAA